MVLDACGAFACCEDVSLHYRFYKRSRCTVEVYAVQLALIVVLDGERCLSLQYEDYGFMCGSDDCIHLGFVCDGIKQCEDGSDEISCNCKLAKI